MGSTVYFMDDRATSAQDSLVAKTLALFDKAGFADMIRPRDVVAIKMHMGEWNNTAYLRPVYVRALVDKIKSLGGIPFVTDTTTLPYAVWSSRVTALDHLMTDERNGFNSGTVGCPVIIADGYFGTDDVHVDLPEGLVLKDGYVSSAIAMADMVLLLSHYKGHGVGVIGGAVKNLGVGCASKRGKFNLHGCGDPRYGLGGSEFKPEICKGRDCPTWQLCDQVCAFDALHVTEQGLVWDADKCRGCFAHRSVISCGALDPPKHWGQVSPVAIADAAMAAYKVIGRDRLACLNLALDISPMCDCVAFSDRPIVPNIGIFASHDPVAIDKACVDAVTAAPGIPGSVAEVKGVAGCGDIKHDTCSSIQGYSQYIQLKAGQRLGLGTMDYELEQLGRLPSVEPYVLNPAGGRPEPIGARFSRSFKKMPFFPEGGFPRHADLDVEDLF
ncbi:MAG: DUF362 domain-containing protein [Dehalococcoidales bacterium]|nr:DUF362 domain-containing protein [Dehalococcoidales bacterium]